MARMIPPVIDVDCKSPGEREIFQRLRDSDGTQDWVVLHSLDLASHRSQVVGELDFVIVVPHKGVLCLEVKGVRSLKREDGVWFLGADAKADRRGPFKQASEAMHSLRTRVISCQNDLGSVLFWSGVVLPFVNFTEVSPEWHSWQVIDARAFNAQPFPKLVEQVLNNARRHVMTSPSGAWLRHHAETPTMPQVQQLVKHLRGDFEVCESPKSRAGRLNEELRRYTEEQFDALDKLERNKRLIFEGPAGTGKTLLALEAARRGRNAGRRILLLCFNRLLGKWLSGQTAPLQPQIVSGHFHSHLMTIAGLREPLDAGRDFWERDLPEIALQRLIEDGRDDLQFDELILDEAQDLLVPEYLDFLDWSLKGGLAAGRWRMFGDFERQAIYGREDDCIEKHLFPRTGNTPVYSLRENCRNTPRIAEFVHLLADLNPRYAKVLRPDNELEPQLQIYKSPEEQREMLARILTTLRTEGFAENEIIVLSPRSQGAAALLEATAWRDRLRPLQGDGGRGIGYSTVHAFKGLEAPAVVVTDIEEIGTLDAKALFYVAVTRAVYRLIILVRESARNQALDLLQSTKA